MPLLLKSFKTFPLFALKKQLSDWLSLFSLSNLLMVNFKAAYRKSFYKFVYSSFHTRNGVDLLKKELSGSHFMFSMYYFCYRCCRAHFYPCVGGVGSLPDHWYKVSQPLLLLLQSRILLSSTWRRMTMALLCWESTDLRQSWLKVFFCN